MQCRFLRSWVFWIAAGLALVTGLAGECRGAEFSGRVLDARSGRPLEGSLVELQPGRQEARCGAEGRFRFADVEPGSYNLRVRSPGYQEQFVRVEVGTGGRWLEIGLAAQMVEKVVVRAAAGESIAASRLQGEEVYASGRAGLGRLLREVPGVASVRRGASGLDPVVRGLREDQVATFVDGGRTFPACPGRMDSGVAHIDPEAVGRIEVVKGPYAITRGAGALSTVTVQTERPGRFADRSLAGRVRAGGESNTGARSGHLTLKTGDDRSGYLVSLTSRRGDDYEAGGGAEVPADYRGYDLRFLAEWDLREQSTLSIDLGYQDQDDIDYPGRSMDSRLLDARSYRVGYESRAEGETFLGYKASAHSNRVDHLMDNQGKPSAAQMQSEAGTEVNTSGGRVAFDWGRPQSWILTAGVDAYDLKQNGRRLIHRTSDGVLLFDDAIWNDARIRDVGLFAEQTLFAGGHQEWTWGLRMDGVSARSEAPSQYFLDHTEGDLSQKEFNVGAALRWQTRLREAWTLTAGVGRAVRTASALERYSNLFPSTLFQVSAEFLGDPDIDPETAYQLDVGAKLHRRRFDWHLDAFYREIDDYITVIPDPSLTKHIPSSLDTVYRYVNGNRATYVGIEMVGELRLDGDWTARFQADWVRAQDEQLGEPVFGIPPLRGSAALRYTRPSGRYYLEGRVSAAGRQTRVATSRYEVPTPGYTLYGVRIGFRLAEGASLEIVGENLTDKFYVDHLNGIDPFTGARVPEPGRTVSLAALWTF